MIVRYVATNDRQVLVEIVAHGSGRGRFYTFRLLGVPPEPGELETFRFYLDALRAGLKAAEAFVARPLH